MQKVIIWLLIIIAIICFWHFGIKPYYTKYETTQCYTGGLGQGKTLNAVKDCVSYIKRAQRKVKIHNWIIRFRNRHFRKNKEDLLEQEIPQLYSNIPILLKKGRRGKKDIYCYKLTKEHLLLKNSNYRIEDGSCVFIDELPQFVNQFNWNIKEVQDNINEFITFYRHYIGGIFVFTAQSIDDVVVQIRRKMNTYYQLFGFQKILWIFYRCQIANLPTSDNITTVSTTFVEENTKWKYGLLIPKRYNSRCYAPRYDKITDSTHKRYIKDTTKKIIRAGNYVSPLDPEETKPCGKQ